MVVGVGGFLGAGEKDVIVPFSAIKIAKSATVLWTAGVSASPVVKMLGRSIWSTTRVSVSAVYGRAKGV
nr:hypothetical protein [Bradyrhizobium acaciae]